MKKSAIQPGDLLKAHQAGKSTASFMKRMKHKASGPIKARGVPSGVIGMLAHPAGAAPGGPNFHGKRGKHMKRGKRKAAEPSKGDLGMVMKRAHKRKGASVVHHHIHVHGKGTAHIHMGGFSAAHGEHEEKRKRKGSAHIEPVSGFGRADDLHEEKHSARKRKSSSHGHGHKAVHVHMKGACKTCGKTACKHEKRSKKV